MKPWVVVGGGLAGFSAAIELALRAAKDGRRILLLEQSRNFGGRAATQHPAEQPAYAWNLGPHGFYRAGRMKAQFEEWGIPFSGKPPLGAGKSLLLWKDGKSAPMPSSAGALLLNTAFSLADRLRIARGLAAIGRPATDARKGESFLDWALRHGATTPASAGMIAAFCRLSTYAADLDLLDAAAAIAQLRMAINQSVLYLDGGWQTLIDGLAAKARSLGVEVRGESGVATVSKSACVHLRGGSVIEANGVILAIPPSEVERVTGVSPARSPLTPARAACLDLGLRKLPDGAAAFGLGIDEPVYVSVHSHYAKGLAPQGGAMVHIAKYLPAASDPPARAELEHYADRTMPGWRDEVAVSRFLPDMTVTHSIPLAASGRPDVDALTGWTSVRVAGDWVGPEAMLADAAVASGLRAARSLS